jgi:hypothetical protein
VLFVKLDRTRYVRDVESDVVEALRTKRRFSGCCRLEVKFD